MNYSRSRRSLADWLARMYMLNAIIVAVVLLGFMVMFGILSGSLAAGFAFPLALASMAAERDAWGLWMLSPLYLLPILLLARQQQRRRTA